MYAIRHFWKCVFVSFCCPTIMAKSHSKLPRQNAETRTQATCMLVFLSFRWQTTHKSLTTPTVTTTYCGLQRKMRVSLSAYPTIKRTSPLCFFPSHKNACTVGVRFSEAQIVLKSRSYSKTHHELKMYGLSSPLCTLIKLPLGFTHVSSHLGISA